MRDVKEPPRKVEYSLEYQDEKFAGVVVSVPKEYLLPKGFTIEFSKYSNHNFLMMQLCEDIPGYYYLFKNASGVQFYSSPPCTTNNFRLKTLFHLPSNSKALTWALLQ